MNLDKFKSKILPLLLSIAVLGVYLLLAFHYVPIIHPVMDEGTYLLKGKWFLEGRYKPYQDYGPITNKPHLSFISLGLSQLIEPGLRSGRYYAIFLSVVLLIGQWLTVKRLSNSWWALFSISLYAISPAWIIYFSRARTEILTSMLIIWSLFLIIGKDRKVWQLSFGLIISAIIVLIRQNLLPFYLFSLIYVVLENGLKKSRWVIFSSIVVFVILNLQYWPQIFPVIWEPYFPEFINQFIRKNFAQSLSFGDLGISSLNRDYKVIYEIQVFFDGVRYFFIPFSIAIFSFLLILKKSFRNNTNKIKIFYLSITFLFLSAIHYYYALTENVVLYSFPAYFGFFIPLAITLIPLVFKEILSTSGKAASMSSVFIILTLTSGIGLSLYRQIAPFFMNLNIPSLSKEGFLRLAYPVWDVLLNRFDISRTSQEFIIPTFIGFLFGVILIVLSLIIRSSIKKFRDTYSFTGILFLCALLIGIILTPTKLLAAEGSIGTCPNSDIVTRHEEIGEYLVSLIPPDSLVYWEGYTPLTLLYLPDIRVFPGQLNMQFYYREGGDPDYLEKKGYWNEELALKWIQEADFLLLSPESYQMRIENFGQDIFDNFKELAMSNNINPCDQDSTIRIFERIN